MFSRKQMIKLLAPLIAEQIMAVLVGMVDVVMVAAVGESAVSGVSLVDSISVLIIQIMGALATGGAVISAQYLGKEQPRDARKAAGQLVLVTLLLSVIIAGTALAGGRHLLGGIFGKVEQDVMDNAQTYFSFELWSSFLRIRPMTNQYLIRINMSSPLPVIIQRNDIHFSADSIEINQYASILCANPCCCRIA